MCLSYLALNLAVVAVTIFCGFVILLFRYLVMKKAAPSLVDPMLAEQRRRSKQAFAYIAEALKLDENSSNDDKTAAVEYYRLGVAELQAGVAVQVMASGEDRQKANKIHLKMKNNLAMAQDRLNYLESLQWMQQQSVQSPEQESSRISAPTPRPLSATRSRTFTMLPPAAPGSSSPLSSGGVRRCSSSEMRTTGSQSVARRSSRPSCQQPAVSVSGRTAALSSTSSTTTTTGEGGVSSIGGRRLAVNSSAVKPNSSNSTPSGIRRTSATGPTGVNSDVSRRVPANVLRSLDSRMANLILDDVVESTGANGTASGTAGDPLQCIVGNDTAKRALHELVILPAARPELFTGLRAPIRGLLLFGPPGNGKTMLARALASASAATFFNISASSLTSKWHGEGEKMVRTLFTLARHLQPSIIFMDEVDALLSERGEGEQEASRRLKTEFLCQFDGLVSSTSDDRILVLAATNRPFDLDRAVLRRFPKRIYIQLPSCSTREQLLLRLLKEHQSRALPAADLRRLAQLTEGFSASDITALARDAALGPIRELSQEEVARADPRTLRAISIRDFTDALKRVRKSVSDKTLSQFELFQSEYGDLTA